MKPHIKAMDDSERAGPEAAGFWAPSDFCFFQWNR